MPPTPPTPTTPSTSKANIACSTVWGGNRAIESSLELPGLVGHVVSRPHKNARAGGDVHVVSSCGTGRITRLVLCDVSGHGKDAASVADLLRNLLRKYLNQIEPQRLATAINSGLSLSSDTDGRFATAVMMTFFSPTGELTLCNAGHPPPLVYRHARRSWGSVDQPDTEQAIANLPLGILEETGYVGRSLDLTPGDMLLAYTDCLIEARHNGDGHELGVAGLHKILDSITDPGDTPESLCDKLDDAIIDAGYTLDDDLTLLLLRHTESSDGLGFANRVMGTLRGMRTLVTHEPIPWPEFTRRNLGALFVKKWSYLRSR